LWTLNDSVDVVFDFDMLLLKDLLFYVSLAVSNLKYR
jgi:hypothetical protein